MKMGKVDFLRGRSSRRRTGTCCSFAKDNGFRESNADYIDSGMSLGFNAAKEIAAI